MEIITSYRESTVLHVIDVITVFTLYYYFLPISYFIKSITYRAQQLYIFIFIAFYASCLFIYFHFTNYLFSFIYFCVTRSGVGVIITCHGICRYFVLFSFIIIFFIFGGFSILTPAGCLKSLILTCASVAMVLFFSYVYRPPRSSGYWRPPGCWDWSGWRARSTDTRNTARLCCCCWWPRSRWSPTGWRAYGTRSATRNDITLIAKWVGWTCWLMTRTSSTRRTTRVGRALG